MSSKSSPEEVVPLTSLKRGSIAEVSRFDMTDRSTLRKLLSLGIVPGTKLRVIYTFPSFVIQLDSSQMVFDKELASSIKVKLVTD